MTPSSYISKDRRVTATVATILVCTGTIVGGTGTAVTLLVRADAKDQSHDAHLLRHGETLGDHEKRLRLVESEIAPALARIETEVKSIKERLK